MRHFIACILLIIALTAFAQQDSTITYDATLSNYTYPYPVHTITLHNQQQELQMAYMDVSPTNAANGKTVLLLHGKNFNGAYWETTAKALVTKGFRVIMPDQVGFGKSSKPAHYQYTFQQLALNTKALLDSLQIEKVAIVGHSMGGMLATRFTLLFPAMLNQFVLVNPIGLEDWKRSVPYASIQQQYQKELKQTYASLKKYQQENYYHGTWQPAYDQWLNLLAGWLNSADYPVIAWNSALTSDMIFTQPVVYEFDQIKAPTLLIIGQADRTALGKDAASATAKKMLGNYPALGKATQQKIKGSKLIELKGVGHLPHIEAFEQFIKPLLSFLD